MHKLKLKHSLGAYYNKNKCAKSPRDHFIDPQMQATFFVCCARVVCCAREAARRAHLDAFGANRGAPWRDPTNGG